MAGVEWQIVGLRHVDDARIGAQHFGKGFALLGGEVAAANDKYIVMTKAKIELAGVFDLAEHVAKSHQISSALTSSLDPNLVVQRLHAYAAATGQAGDPLAAGPNRAADILGNVVRTAATTQGIIDAFVALSGLTAVALILLVVQRQGPRVHRSPQPRCGVEWQRDDEIPKPSGNHGDTRPGPRLHGPDYHAPALPAGSVAPLVSMVPKLEVSQEPPDEWWRLYDDKKLDLLVERAFAANADLAVAKADLSAARALLEGARNGLYPATTEQSAAINGRDATRDEILAIDGKMLTNGWMFDNILDVSYELDLFGRVHRSIEASNADAEAAAAARDAVKITVAAETARAYAQICALGEQIGVARHSLTLAVKETEITINRLRAGSGSDFDVVRTEAVTATTRAAIPPLEGQRRAALFELAALIGVAPARAPLDAETCKIPPHLTDPIPVGSSSTVLARRPDVHLADRQLAAATARIGVATADLYPRISLTGLFGGASSEPQGLVALRGLTVGHRSNCQLELSKSGGKGEGPHPRSRSRCGR